MVSFEEAGEMLDEIADGLPEEFYHELNGGIVLLPGVKLHPESGERYDLYIIGEYHRDRALGKYISIYYGSFAKAYAHLTLEGQKNELRRVLLHEFTHHLEALSGERGLEIKDEMQLERYRNRD